MKGENIGTLQSLFGLGSRHYSNCIFCLISRRIIIPSPWMPGSPWDWTQATPGLSVSPRAARSPYVRIREAGPFRPLKTWQLGELKVGEQSWEGGSRLSIKKGGSCPSLLSRASLLCLANPASSCSFSGMCKVKEADGFTFNNVTAQRNWQRSDPSRASASMWCNWGWELAVVMQIAWAWPGGISGGQNSHREFSFC